MASVAWSVRRDNRAAAEAFCDPDGLDGIFRWHSPAARRARLGRWLALAVILGMGSAAFHYLRNGSAALLEVIPAVPTVSLPAPIVAVPAEAAKPIESGKSIGTEKPGTALGKGGPIPTEGPEAPGPIALASLAAAPDVPVAPAPALFPEKGYCLIACKRDRTLYVYKRDGKTWDRTAAFPMAIGRNAGDKGDAGDLRTPEGRFWITGMLSGEAKGKMYGPLVFTLNYPRPGDAAEGKTGQGIWIHGVEAGKLPTWTHGCLSLANEDIMALSAYADVGIPVVILSDSLSPDPARQADVAGMEREFPSIMAAHMRVSKADSSAKLELLRKARDYIAKEAKAFPELGMQALSPAAKQAILARLEKWRSDWMSRSIDAYSANYDPAFKDRMGRDRQSFLDRKRRIFESKTKIEMEIRDPRIESEGYARARISFRQEYTAEGPQGPQRSSELKSLRLEEGPAGWLIITE
jgi:murein L,D-transpeptidase YafK